MRRQDAAETPESPLKTALAPEFALDKLEEDAKYLSESLMHLMGGMTAQLTAVRCLHCEAPEGAIN